MPVNELKEGVSYFSIPFEFVVVDTKMLFDLYVNSSTMMCVSICAHLSQRPVLTFMTSKSFTKNIISCMFQRSSVIYI